MAARRSAGAKLRAKMNAALVATGVAGAEFTELETEAIDAACSAADRGEQLQRVYDAELSGDVGAVERRDSPLRAPVATDD